MAEVIVNASLAEKRWLVNDYILPYIRMSGFDKYMGRDANAPIRVFNETLTDGGKTIIVPLVGLLRGEGVSGSQVLEGNEEDMSTYVDEVRCNWRRNAVKVPKSSSYKTNLDLLKVAKPNLRQWAARQVLKRGLILQSQGIVVPGAIDAEGYPTADTVVSYANSTAGQRNAFMVNNADRILFGIDIANASSGIWATALGNVDGTNDKLTSSMISKARRLAQATGELDAVGPPITPYMTETDGEEWFVLLVTPRQMRDLRADTVIQQANRDAMPRGKDNPLFRAGDLVWDGVIIHEVQDLQYIVGGGAAGIDVAQALLLGQSALAIAWGQEPRFISDRKQDYEFRPATAVEELIGIKKTSYAGKQYGIFTLITAAAADT